MTQSSKQLAAMENNEKHVVDPVVPGSNGNRLPSHDQLEDGEKKKKKQMTQAEGPVSWKSYFVSSTTTTQRG